MGDYPIAELDGRTPLEAARTPNMDTIARQGRGGTIRTIPPGLHPGSEIGNLSLMGYDPKVYNYGRGSFEAASLGIELEEDDVAFRCNLVTFRDDSIEDYCAGHLTTGEAGQLIDRLNDELAGEGIRFYTGIAYRHLLVVSGGSLETRTTPPHDIMGKPLAPYRPGGPGSRQLIELIDASVPLLEEAPVNRKRVADGLRPANMIWPWGQGPKPGMASYQERFGLRGAVIAAVDLIRGIGVAAGLEPIIVPGATGDQQTDFTAKGLAAVKAIEEDCDFIYLHVEAPDDAGHDGDLDAKIKAIENFDKLTVGTVLAGLSDRAEPVRFAVVTDHYTPISLRTHSAEPTPFALYYRGIEPDGMSSYCEREAERGAAVGFPGVKFLEEVVWG